MSTTLPDEIAAGFRDLVRAEVRAELHAALSQLSNIDSLDGQLAISVAGAARTLDVSRDTVYALIKAGELETFVEGRGTKVTVDSLRAYVRRRVAA